jgi:hypothetical protein
LNYRRVVIEAFSCVTGPKSVIGTYEGQSDLLRNLRHHTHPV